MLKRKNNTSTFKIETFRGTYAVNLEKLKNTEAGQPRFKATVITLQVRGEEPPEGEFFTSVWQFLGHYMSDREEEKWIVERYEEKLDR